MSYGQFCSFAHALELLGERWTLLVVRELLCGSTRFSDIQRGIPLPDQPLVVRVELTDHRPAHRRFLLLRRTEASLCTTNPGFPESVVVTTPTAALAAWWRGDATFPAAQRAGLRLEGRRALVRAFAGWFDRYMLAGVPAAAAA